MAFLKVWMYLLLTHESTREKCSPLAHGLRLELSNVGKIRCEFPGTKKVK